LAHSATTTNESNTFLFAFEPSDALFCRILTPWLPVYECIVLGNRPNIKHILVVLPHSS